MFERLKNWHMENITRLNTYTKIINAISHHIIEMDQIRDIFINIFIKKKNKILLKI